MSLSHDLPEATPPATVHIVPISAAEQVLADVERRLAALETELDAVMREVEDAERQVEAADRENERLLALAEDLLGSGTRPPSQA